MPIADGTDSAPGDGHASIEQRRHCRQPSLITSTVQQPLIPLDDALPAGTFQIATELGRLFGGSERADHGAVIDPLGAEIGALDDWRTGPQRGGETNRAARGARQSAVHFGWAPLHLTSPCLALLA